MRPGLTTYQRQCIEKTFERGASEIQLRDQRRAYVARNAVAGEQLAIDALRRWPTSAPVST